LIAGPFYESRLVKTRVHTSWRWVLGVVGEISVNRKQVCPEGWYVTVITGLVWAITPTPPDKHFQI
jgi:hypothetical protein